MRAWLLLLIVLATFQTIVQVASTEDSTGKLRAELQQQVQQVQQRKAQTFKKDLIILSTSSDLSSSSSSSTTADTTALTIKTRKPQENRENRENRANRENRDIHLNRENRNNLVLVKQVQSANRNTNNKDNLNRNINNQDPFTNLTINMQNILENHIVNYHKHKYKKQRKERLEKIEEQRQRHRHQIHQQVDDNRNLLEYQTIIQSIGHQSPTPYTTTTTTATFEDFHKLAERERMQPTQTNYLQHLQQHRNRLYPRHQRKHHSNYHSVHHPSHLHLQHIELENKSKHQPTISQSLTEAEEFIANAQSKSPPNDRLSNSNPSKVHQSKHKHKHTPAAVRDDGPIVQTSKLLNPAVRDEIKNGLLSLLKMERPPAIDRSKIVIPEIMTKLYAQKMRQDWNYIVRSFTHKPSKIDERFPNHHRFRLYFDVSSIPAEEKLKAAELQLFREIIRHSILHPRLANRTRYQVLVYDILRLGIKAKRPPKFLLLDNKQVWLNSSEMVSLDVRHAVDRWLAAPKNNHGLLVEVRTPRSLKPAQHHHVRLRRSTEEEDQMWRHKQPFLITYTDNGHHKSRSIRDVTTRSKRAGHSRKSKRRKNHDEICQRRPLYVDFSEVGWSDWIVAPPGYDAFYCQGKCPFPLPDHLNSTNHAVVQTIANDIHPGKVPHACCVPTQLEGHSFLYLNDENTVVLKNYEDMAVVGCGCR